MERGYLCRIERDVESRSWLINFFKKAFQNIVIILHRLPITCSNNHSCFMKSLITLSLATNISQNNKEAASMHLPPVEISLTAPVHCLYSNSEASNPQSSKKAWYLNSAISSCSITQIQCLKIVCPRKQTKENTVLASDNSGQSLTQKSFKAKIHEF